MKLHERDFAAREAEACQLVEDVRTQFINVYLSAIRIGLDGGMATGKGTQANIHRESGFLISSTGGFYRACSWLCLYLNILDGNIVREYIDSITIAKQSNQGSEARQLQAALQQYIEQEKRLIIQTLTQIELSLVSTGNIEHVVVSHPDLGRGIELDVQGVLREPHIEEITKFLSGVPQITLVVDEQIKTLAKRSHRFFGEGRDKRDNMKDIPDTWIGYTTVTKKERNEREVARRTAKLGRPLTRAEEKEAIAQAKARDASDMDPKRTVGRLMEPREAIKSGQYDGYIDTTKFTPCEVALITYWLVAHHFIPHSLPPVMAQIENEIVGTSASVRKLPRKHARTVQAA